LTLWASVATGAGAELVAAVGIFGSAVLAVALVFRWPDVLPWGIAILGGQYAASLLLRGGEIDPLAPFYAAVLFVTAEFAFWALEAKPALGGRTVVVRRLARLVMLASGAAAAGAGLLAASEGGARGGLWLGLLGLFAAVATLGLVTWLAWRAPANYLE
jgi:hypothetical protein